MSINNLGLGFVFSAKDGATGVMKKVKSGLLGVSSSAEKTDKTMSGSFSKLGRGIAGLGAAVGGVTFLKSAIQESNDYGQAIALVATEANEAIFPQSKMRDVTRQLAQQYGNLPVDEAKALYKAVALGADDAAKSQSFLNGVNLLAVAGNADLELSANALGGALNAYHADFSEATAYSDAFFTAMKRGNTTVQDLAASVGRVTATAANLNVSIDEILGAVSVMTNQGVKADEAVSGLKEALANVVHPSADAAKEAARLGIKFNQTELRAKGLQGFLKEITSSSRFTAASMSKLFTSVEGANAIMQVSSNNMSAYNATMEAMGQKAGATQKGFEIMTKTLAFQKKQFEANKKVMLGVIGEALEPLEARALGFANKLIMAFLKAPKPVQNMITKFATLAAGALSLIGAVTGIVSAFGFLAGGGEVLAGVFGGLSEAFAPILLVFGAAAIVFGGFKTAYEQNLGGFKDFVKDIVKDVKLLVEGLYQVFTQGGFSGQVRKDLNNTGGNIKQFVINVYVWFGRIKNFISNVFSGFEIGMKKARPAIDAFEDAFHRLTDTLANLFSGPQNPKDAAATFDAFGSTGASVGQLLVNVFSVVLNVFTSFINLIDGVIEGWEAMQPAVQPLYDAIGGLVDTFEDLFVTLGLTQSGVGGASSSIVTIGKVIGYVAGGIAHALSYVVRIIQAMVYAVDELLKGVHAVMHPIDTITGVSSGGNQALVKGFAQPATPQTYQAAPGAGAPVITAPSGPGAMPAAAAAGASADVQSMNADALKKALEDFQKNQAPGTPPMNINLLLDGQVLGRASVKAQKNDDIRSLNPSPSPT